MRGSETESDDEVVVRRLGGAGCCRWVYGGEWVESQQSSARVVLSRPTLLCDAWKLVLFGCLGAGRWR